MPVNQGAAASFLLPLRRFGGEGWGEGEGLAVANAYFVGSSQMPGLVPGAFNFYVGTDPQKLTLVRAAFEEEIARLAANGLDSAELARAKKKLIGKQAISHQSNASLAFTVSLDELYGLGYLHYREVPAAIEAVTLEEVRATAQRLFRGQPAVVAIVRPPTTPIPGN